MRLFRSLLLASTCLLSSLDASTAARAESQADDEAYVASASRQGVYTMGFEAETSVFKVRPSQGDQTYKMMIFKAPAEKPHLWAFTSDTLDATIEKLEPPHWMNTECITLGGLNSIEIIKTAEEVKQFWDFLRTRLSDPKAEVCLTGRDIPLAVSWSDSNVEYDSIIIQKPDVRDYQQRQLIYPQITFGLPLIEIHNLFEHIATYLSNKRHPISTFWLELNGRDIELESSALPFAEQAPVNTPGSASATMPEETPEEKLRRIRASIASRALAKIYKSNNDPQLERATKKALIDSCKPIISRKPSPATGLALLTAYYAYSLFSNNLSITKQEPGPKPNLGIMSRLSFSEMFHKLYLPEQEVYKTLVTDCMSGYFSNKLVKYNSAETNCMIDEGGRISFKEWFDSIILTPEIDLLSPPPGCREIDPPYAMGAYQNFKSGHALLEIRAYSERDPTSERYITIDNFCQFIESEARWFFSLQQTRGGNDENQ